VANILLALLVGERRGRGEGVADLLYERGFLGRGRFIGEGFRDLRELRCLLGLEFFQLRLYPRLDLEFEVLRPCRIGLPGVLSVSLRCFNCCCNRTGKLTCVLFCNESTSSFENRTGASL
jgi:hypothetical protein